MSSLSKSSLLDSKVIRNCNGDVFVVTKPRKAVTGSIAPVPKSETQSVYMKPSACSAGDNRKPLVPYKPNALRNSAKIYNPKPRSCHDTNLPRGAPCSDGTSEKKRWSTSKQVECSHQHQPIGFGNPGILASHTKFVRKLENA
ncbi:hypothetical protein GEMRC1_007324 [Eukaryota sp. GEM-RC1]